MKSMKDESKRKVQMSIRLSVGAVERLAEIAENSRVPGFRVTPAAVASFFIERGVSTPGNQSVIGLRCEHLVQRKG